ncbi:DUF4276 family protein [Pseudoduganella sp. SL102]|uniref:DUF4276 family protein n=1 Tax=Pseudoduganella sp. SL102 TaxID=2995154 RepID=UPI00248B6852|nr:DUF4276 family protein [Pseudoduganella sp. SL102]WBS03503.1 DUF4276 family protein [Pseudoduganella sp. SL102]
MTRIYVMVEGQTEEAFVTELLAPHFAHTGRYLIPIIVSTSRGHKGGMVSYAKVRPQLQRKCKEDPTSRVTTMFDLYALPNDFPGHEAARHLPSGLEKARYLEAQLGLDIALANFVPNIVVHEYEALLFSDPERFADWVARKVVDELTDVRKHFATPEDINDSPHTAPSKRIISAFPAYQKTFHGPLIACDIGLDTIRAACPHFHAWLLAVEAL